MDIDLCLCFTFIIAFAPALKSRRHYRLLFEFALQTIADISFVTFCKSSVNRYVFTTK